MLGWLLPVPTVLLLMTVTVTSLPRHAAQHNPRPTEDTLNGFRYTPAPAPPQAPHKSNQRQFITVRPKVQSSHQRSSTVGRVLTGNRINFEDINRRIEDEAEDVICDQQPQRRSPTQDAFSSSQSTRLPCIRANQTTTLQRPPTATVTQQPRQENTVRALGDIVFPDGDLYPSFVPRKSKCRGRTFCEEVEGDYPREHIKKILEIESEKFKGVFGEDVVNEVSVNITQRIDISDENQLCPSREQVVYPKQAQNKDEKWLFIVNQDKYMQGVRVEICAKEGPCMLSEGFPLGYKTSCKQKYIYRKLLALNEAGEPTSDSFRLPSCCVCYVKLDPIARMGSVLSKNMSPAVKPNATHSRKSS